MKNLQTITILKKNCYVGKWWMNMRKEVMGIGIKEQGN
jgi:hypothetical protein